MKKSTKLRLAPATSTGKSIQGTDPLGRPLTIRALATSTGKGGNTAYHYELQLNGTAIPCVSYRGLFAMMRADSDPHRHHTNHPQQDLLAKLTALLSPQHSNQPYGGRRGRHSRA